MCSACYLFLEIHDTIIARGVFVNNFIHQLVTYGLQKKKRRIFTFARVRAIYGFQRPTRCFDLRIKSATTRRRSPRFIAQLRSLFRAHKSVIVFGWATIAETRFFSLSPSSSLTNKPWSDRDPLPKDVNLKKKTSLNSFYLFFFVFFSQVNCASS